MLRTQAGKQTNMFSTTSKSQMGFPRTEVTPHPPKDVRVSCCFLFTNHLKGTSQRYTHAHTHTQTGRNNRKDVGAICLWQLWLMSVCCVWCVVCCVLCVPPGFSATQATRPGPLQGLTPEARTGRGPQTVPGAEAQGGGRSESLGTERRMGWSLYPGVPAGCQLLPKNMEFRFPYKM